jgi:hypothetical protein
MLSKCTRKGYPLCRRDKSQREIRIHMSMHSIICDVEDTFMNICNSFHARRIYMPMSLNGTVQMYMFTTGLH